MAYQFHRRDFLCVAAAGAASLAMSKRLSAKDVNGKLRLASIGIGGKGQDDLQSISASPQVEVVALCNVDESQPHLGWAAEAFPKAEKFRDCRRLLDKANMFDAVSVSTPDHMHAPIALAAMALGKHACLGDGKTKSNFGYSGPLTETVLLGGIAIRFPKEQLLWDSKSAQFTHHADANSRLTKEYRAGWTVPTAWGH